MQMQKEQLEIQRVCESAETFDDILKCLDLSQKFVDKWNLAIPTSLQYVSDSDAQIELLS